MKYARRAARWLTLFGGASNPWKGATWALDGSGRAYNVPTLGSELLTNGGFGSDTAGWTSGNSAILSSVAGGASGNALRVENGIANVGWAYQSASVASGSWLQFAFSHKNNSTSGIVRLATTFDGSDMAAPSSFSDANWTSRVLTARSLSASTFVRLAIGTTTLAATTLYDSVSLTAIPLPTTLATIAGTTPTQTAAARIRTLTSGTQAGVVSLLDSASNPQNGLFAYHDGTGVTLDKVVNGVWTNIVPRVTVAFSSLAQIEIRRPSGNTFQLWYDGSQRGSNVTVSDAGIINNTLYGLFSTYEGNLFSEFSLDGAMIPFLFPAPAPTFAPTLLADLWAWYDASDISSLYQDSGRTTPVVTDGDPVGAASDKSGNARHMLQAGASTLKPTYTTNVQNGLPSFSFDGGDYLDTVATVNSFPLTIVGVARTSATIGTTRGLVSSRNSTTFGTRQYIQSTNTLIAQIDTPTKTIVSAASVAADTTFLFASRFGTTLISQTLNATTEDDTHAAAATANIVSLGRLNVNSTASLANGHLLEVVIYNRALTADELTQVQTYLNTKWAVY